MKIKVINLSRKWQETNLLKIQMSSSLQDLFNKFCNKRSLNLPSGGRSQRTKRTLKPISHQATTFNSEVRDQMFDFPNCLSKWSLTWRNQVWSRSSENTRLWSKQLKSEISPDRKLSASKKGGSKGCKVSYCTIKFWKNQAWFCLVTPAISSVLERVFFSNLEKGFRKPSLPSANFILKNSTLFDKTLQTLKWLHPLAWSNKTPNFQRQCSGE